MGGLLQCKYENSSSNSNFFNFALPDDNFDLVSVCKPLRPCPGRSVKFLDRHVFDRFNDDRLGDVTREIKVMAIIDRLAEYLIHHRAFD